ncbi:protein required for normal CLN1 and CLN2 G1 cyclin expression [Coemansia sp. RSA 1933]|nr:protein required for normal CLN1 and CLN2 G1 cyclin expression [Coemansia sp. RSA 1933]
MVVLEARVIEVPIDNSNDVLEIDCSQLPDHATEICDILENEGSALRFYHLFALEYYKQGNIEEAVVALKRGMANAKANDQTAKVPLLALLASIYVQKAKTAAGASAGTGGDRDMLLQMAATLLNEAERINRSEPNIFLVKGMLAIAQRLPDSALVQFNTALQYDANNLSCLVGKARVLFGKRQFQQALAIYQQILVIKPTGKPDARIGIGMCLYKLGYSEDARRALARAIEVDPTAAAPHILLATMDLNAVKRSVDPRIASTAAGLEKKLASAAELVHRATDSLRKAYELQSDNPAALIFLADRLFFHGNYDGARKLGERALSSADTMAIQAEAHYQVARAYHANKRFDMAYDAYQRCLAINERHSLARYGLGQMQLQRTDMSSAEATFQRVLDRHPRCVEVLRALGYLHARLPNTKAKALEYYEREMQVVAEEAVEQPEASDDATTWFDDANLFLEAGLLYEASSAKRARKSYLMAASILTRTSGGPNGVLPELWNNLAALGQLTGDSSDAILAEYRAAADGCSEALAAARARVAEKRAAGEAQRLQNSLVTIRYNVARFYEHRGLWAKADALYRQLVADVPTYADARLRLAHIAFYCRADADSALAHIAQTVALDPKRAAAWLMRGNIELQRSNVQEARRAFEHVLKEIAKHDVYALCSLGNYYLAAGRSESAHAAATAAGTGASASSTAKKARDLAAQNYKRALEFFDKCLVLDPKCALAAHGTAIAMAENDFAAEARRVFQSVRDAATAGLGPASLCNPAATDLVFKTTAAKHVLLPSDLEPLPLPSESPLVGSDVMLWSGINTAHAYVEVGNYRQAVLAYEACSRRLADTTAALEAADLQAKDSSSSQMVVAALEPADCSDDSTSSELQMMTKSERTDRAKAKRDIQLFHARALYIQAKADKDIEVMQLSMELLHQTCDAFDVKLPDSALEKSEANEASDETAAAPSADADGDVSMKSADDKEHRHVQVRLPPDDCLLLFDLALVEQAVAQLASEMPESQRTLKILDSASKNLDHSTATFAFLATWGKAALKKRQKLLYNPKLSSERAAFGKSLVTKLQRKRQEQEQLDRQRQENVDLWRKQQEEEETRKKEEADKVENERLEVESRLLRETEERNAILREQMAAEAAKQVADTAASAGASTPGARSSKKKSRVKEEEEEETFISDHDDLEDYAVVSDNGDDGDDDAPDADASGRRKQPPQRPSTRRISHAGTKKRKTLSRPTKDTPAATPSPKLQPDDGDNEVSTPPPAPLEDPPAERSTRRIKTKAIVTDSDGDSDE